MRQIFAYSGLLGTGPGQPGSFRLVQHALSLASPAGRTRVCYLPTAVGDDRQAIDARADRFAAWAPAADFSVLRLFPQPSVPDVREHLRAGGPGGRPDGTGGHTEEPVAARLL